ncbi:MAG: hypothetical protein ACRC6X_08940 [Culicoidibacterales bacterium]
MLSIIKKIALAVERQNGRCYFVGGYVRDKLLGRQSEDFDIECYGISFALLCQTLAKFGTVLSFGKHFGILRIAQYPNIDFALPRIERKTGDAHTDFAILIDEHLDFLTAARRRDFTVNTMLEDVLTHKIYDPYNGQADLVLGVLRYVDARCFIEDSLRGLRGCRLGSKLNFRVEPQTIKLIASLSYTNLSQERIQTEVKNAIMGPGNLVYYFRLLQDLEIMGKLFPKLALATKKKPMDFHDNLHFAHVIKEKFAHNYPLILAIIFQAVPATDFQKLISSKAENKLCTAYATLLLKLPQATSPKALRAIKNLLPPHTNFSLLISLISQHLPHLLPLQFPDGHYFWVAYMEAISLNPYQAPLFKGRDLIAAGYQPSELFLEMLSAAKQLEAVGCHKLTIRGVLFCRYGNLN